MAWLTALFFLVALIYASVGFGGGSTYTALLGLWGVDYKLIPLISLLCNIIVVTGGTIRFARAGLIDWKAVLPLLLVSAPLAFLGGLVQLKETTFLIILGSTLLLSAIALMLPQERLPNVDLPKPLGLILSGIIGLLAGLSVLAGFSGFVGWIFLVPLLLILSGALLHLVIVLILTQERLQQAKIPNPAVFALSGAVGLLAGLSGIGGGIFMAPVLHLIRWAEARRIAAFASLYILVNSMAGLSGQIIKSGPGALYGPATEYWPLMLAVLVGGQIGGMLGLRFFSPRMLRMITALLVGYVAVRLLGQSLDFW
jgi:uncharacterized protein